MIALKEIGFAGSGGNTRFLVDGGVRRLGDLSLFLLGRVDISSWCIVVDTSA